jgi:hypothetical protein
VISGLPKRGRGRKSEAAEAAYTKELEVFCAKILQIKSTTLDFKISSRGWCYILEEYGLGKGDFDAAQKLINDCRKSGLLPIDICAQDDARAADNIESLDGPDPEAEALAWINTVQRAHRNYTPFSFWDDLDVYIEMRVEKIDLKSLFSPVCEDSYIAITNMRGWSDINSGAEMMLRFKKWEQRGKRCVLLYCGDHDPGGLAISGQIMSNLKDLSNAVGWDPSNLIIDRFGLNYDFIEANRLTWINNLETASGGSLDDPRHPDHNRSYVQSYLRQFGARKVEANALVVRPEAGRQLCRQAILRYVPANAVRQYEERLRPARIALRDEIVRRLAEASQ